MGEVTTQSNPSFDKLQIVKTGTTTSPAVSVADPGAQYSTDNDTRVVPHNLGYKPIVLAFLDVAGTFIPLPYISVAGTGAAPTAFWSHIQIAADSTNLYIDTWITVYDQAGSLGELDIRYYLLRESAN